MYSVKQPTKKFFLFRKHVIIFVTFIIFSCVFTIYINIESTTSEESTVIYFATMKNNISCHYVNEDDVLPSAEDKNFLPKPNSIFFHETSCRGGLISRQACAVESAARAHPWRQVYVMFSGPVSDVIYEESSIAILRRLPNIRFARIHINDYAKNTPLEDMIANKPFRKSKWQVQHSSDVLRYLTLYKWGGVYLDTDMLVVKSLTPLGYNWVGKEDHELMNAAAIAISTDRQGRNLAEAVINEVKATYRPDLWIYNGPGAITRVIHRMCDPGGYSQSLIDWLSSKPCEGLTVYGPEYLFPIHFGGASYYFRPGELANFSDAYTHHFWNKLTFDMEIALDSPYAKLAEKFCPTIYNLYGTEFGY